MRSKWMRQPRSSKLVGERIEPSLQRDGLVLDRAEEAVGKAFGFRPGLAVVTSTRSTCPTSSRGLARPCRTARAVRPWVERGRDSSTGRRFPPSFHFATSTGGVHPLPSSRDSPDADVGKPFVRPAEPGGDQAGPGFDDRRGVRGGEGAFSKMKLLEINPGCGWRRRHAGPVRGPPRAK